MHPVLSSNTWVCCLNIFRRVMFHIRMSHDTRNTWVSRPLVEIICVVWHPHDKEEPSSYRDSGIKREVPRINESCPPPMNVSYPPRMNESCPLECISHDTRNTYIFNPFIEYMCAVSHCVRCLVVYIPSCHRLFSSEHTCIHPLWIPSFYRDTGIKREVPRINESCPPPMNVSYPPRMNEVCPLE